MNSSRMILHDLLLSVKEKAVVDLIVLLLLLLLMYFDVCLACLHISTDTSHAAGT